MGNMSVPQILEHNFLNPNDYLDRKWLSENGPIPSDVSAIWKAEDHIGSQLKKMIDASGEPAYDSALKLQMRTLLEENMGINSERAKTLVDSGYVGKVTNRPTEKPNFIQAAADTFLAVQYNRERGNAFTKYMLTGDERFKQVADRYAEKEKQYSVGTDDWGFFGNQVVNTAKIASSTLTSFVGGAAITGLTTLAGAIVGGPAGAAAGHGIGKALASAFVMWDAGSSQAGSSLYELSLMTDGNGQKIDLESPLAKTIFLVDLLANGAIEVIGMDFLPGYKQLIDAIGPSVARNAIKTTFKQAMQKYGKDVLEGALAEGGEEFFQGWVSDLSNNLLISMTNSKHGTDFDTKKAEAILGDSLSAFVETAKGMVTYGMLTAGVGNGVRGARMKIESSRNQKDEEGSLTIDSSFLNAKKPTHDDEYKPTDKLPPIKVIQTESGAVPASVEDAKNASFLKFNKKASAVKVVPVEAKISTGSHDKSTKNLAYQLDLKVDENGRFVADDENQLSNVVTRIQETLGVISSKQNEDGSTTFSLLDENKESVDFTVGLANQDSKLSSIEPDYGTMDTKLQRILKPKDKYLDAEEHEFVKNRVLESLDGNFTDHDVEAGINSIMIASRALRMTTDELLDHHIQIRFATDDDARQIGQADARGWLEKPVVAANGDTIHTIRLTKNADESTIVHETGHVLRKLASAEQLASFAEAYGGSVGSMWLEDIQEDNGRYLIGEQSFETYAEAFNVIRETEERFADDFVAYLMDGVAPTEDMKGLFARMKEFLKSVYHQFKDRLSDETRKAFDKLLVAEQPGNQGGPLTGNALFQENSEYQAVVEKYKDTPVWMKAPNGQPTHLTERQWVQVRTPSFKNWFGDWEAAEILKWLMNADPVASLPKMVFQKGEQENLVDSILASWKEKVVNHPEVGDIVLDKEGVKSSIGHGVGREKISAFALIPEIIEKGRIISRHSNWKNRGYDTAVIVAPIEMGGIQYVSEVVVVQRPTATKFYLHEVEIRKRLEGAFKTPTEGSAPRTSRLMIARLLAEGKLTSSMGVDDNGEPQVFYHGSYTDDITEFIHQPRLGFQNQAGSRGGFSFTNNRKVAEGYAKPRETRIASISKYVRDLERALDEEGIIDSGMLEDPSNLDERSIRFYELLESDEKTEFAAYERTLPQFEYVYWDDSDNPISEGRTLWSKHVPRVIESEFPELAEKLRKAGRELRIGKGNTTPQVYDVFLRIPEGTNTKNLTPSTLYLIGDDFSVQNEKTGAFVVLMPDGEKVVYIADSNMIKSATDNVGSFDGENPNIFFQEAPADYQPKNTGIGYKVFVGKDGKLYPPMVANPNGEGTPVGKWLLADEAPIAAYSKTGRPQVKSGGKGTQGKSGLLAYRPGWHLGEIPYAKQFNRLNPSTGNKELFPKDFVWAEVEYSKDNDYNEEARQNGVSKNGGFSHALASLYRMPADGYYNYRTNPDPTTDPWVITGAMKVTKILTREEVDSLVKESGREPQKIEGDNILFQHDVLPVDSKWTLFQLEKVGSVVTVRDNAPKAVRVYEVSMQPEEMHRLFGEDKPANLVLDDMATAREMNASPTRVADWQQIYAKAMASKGKDGKDLKFSDMRKVNKDGKLMSVPVIALSKGCQRAQVTVERVQNGVLPSETNIEACYGGTCWVNRQFNSKFGAFENMEVRDLLMPTPDDIDAWFKMPSTKSFLTTGPFIREGQMGCSSHAFPILNAYGTSLAETWLKNVKDLGISQKTIFITAAYAPVTKESYERLLPYNDLFEIHVSISGWFHKNELMIRLAEFEAIREAGLPVSFRIVTNKDNVAGLEMSNQEWLDEKLSQMGIHQDEVLETPYHDDGIKKGQKRSEPTGDYKFICCETGKCLTCGAKCMSKIVHRTSEMASYERVDTNNKSPAVSTELTPLDTSAIPQTQPSGNANGIIDDSGNQPTEGLIEEESPLFQDALSLQRSIDSEPKNSYRDNDVILIDGIEYVKHDLGYEWKKDKLDRLSTEIAENLAGILAQPGIQYELDFGDQSTNGSLFVDQSGDQDILEVRPENGAYIRGYSPVRGWDGSEGSPRIDEDWKRFRKIDFSDYVVRSSSDVAQLFSIYRNPEIEFFHIIFTNGDRIVAHHALTSGLPGITFAVDKNYPDSILEMYKKYGADGYYLLHNHPSGNTEPSREDLNVSLRYNAAIKGYKGHIILNHNKFGFIDDLINSRQISASGFHDIPDRALIHPEALVSPGDIASVAKNLMDHRANLVLYLDNEHRVALAEPVERIDIEAVFEKILNANLSKATVLVTDWAAYHRFIGDYQDSSRKHGKFLLDALKIGSDGSYVSAMESGDMPTRPLSWQDLKHATIRGTQDFLFQLSDQKQKELIQNRRYEIQQLVSGHFYIKDDLLEEFVGEDWADEEIRFRKVLKEFPWVLDAAKKFENVDDYLQSLKSDPMYETSDYEWQEEDEQWFRRIYDYSQIPTPDDLDRQFVQQYTTDPKMLLMLSKKMSNYEDVGIPIQHRTHKQPTFIRKYGAFKGVSTKFLRLNNESSLAELSQVVDMIQANPRPYRKALQIVDQAESRVHEARGIGGREGIAYDYYSAFGEDLEDDLKKLQEESEEQAKQERLKSIPKEIQTKSVAEISELEQSSESVLRNLGEQDSTAAELSKKLEKATAIAKGITGILEATRIELQKSQQEYRKLRSELEREEQKLGRRDARITSLLDKLAQAKQTNMSLDKELDKTQRDLVSQAEWRAFFVNLAELRGKRILKQEQSIRELVADLQDRRERVNTLRDELTTANKENHRLENALQAAKNREATRKFRQAFKDVQARIIKNSTFNSNTMDAYFEEAMSYVNNLFSKDVVSYPGEFPALLRDYMPEWFDGYESIPRGDNRMASWSIDELLAIDVAAQMMATDARVKKVARDGEIQARRQQIALQHFRQIYFRMPKLQITSGKSANMMADIAEDVNTTKQKYHNGQEGKLAKTWHSITMSFAHIQRIARLVDGNMEGAMFNLFARDLWDGYNTEYREIQRRLSALEEKRKALKFTDQYLAQELITYKAGGATDITLTREEAIGVYIYSRNKMAMEKLLSHGGNGMSVFDISDIVAKLDKKDIEFGNYLIESIGGDTEYERLKAATYRIYNINLGREEHYFPLRAKGLEVEGSADLITGPTRSSISYIDKGMTVERVHAQYQVDLAVLSTWQDVMRQQEHLMALGQWVKDANYLLGPNGSVGHTISTNFGSTIRQAMQDFVNRVAGQKDNARYVSKIFNTLLSKASASMISYNVSSMMKQMASLSAVLRGGINPVRFFQMMLSPVGPHPRFKNWKAARNLMYELAPDMKSRTFNVEVQRFRDLKNTTEAGRTLKKITDFGLEHGTGAVDSIVVTRLWWAAYMTALDKRLPSEEAVFKASQFIAESQSTTNQMDMSLIQQSENSFFRIITQFRNDAFQHWNQIFFDLPYHIRNKMWTNAAGDLASVLVGGAVITLATGAFLGEGGDDEKWWERFLRALFPNLLGEFIPFAGEAIANSFNGYSSGGVLSLGSDIGNFIREATDDDDDFEALSNRVWDMIASLGTTAGVPTLTPKRILKAVAEENPWRLIGGYWYRMWEDAQ